MRWYFDTSVLVAAAVDQHVHNSRALSVLETMHVGKHHGYLSTHSLTEIYSVLTRTPFRPAVRPTDALKAIEDQVLSCMTLVSLDDTEYVDMSAAQRGLDRTLISQNPRLVHNCVRPTHPCHTRLHVLATIIKINEINQYFRAIAYGAQLATMVGESFEVL